MLVLAEKEQEEAVDSIAPKRLAASGTQVRKSTQGRPPLAPAHCDIQLANRAHVGPF
jgi:hypothetical protein